MTLAQAKTAAQMESRKGYVQHINIIVIDLDDGLPEYKVSDWYDYELTVCSYENGNELP